MRKEIGRKNSETERRETERRQRQRETEIDTERKEGTKGSGGERTE